MMREFNQSNILIVPTLVKHDRKFIVCFIVGQMGGLHRGVLPRGVPQDSLLQPCKQQDCQLKHCQENILLRGERSGERI